MCIYIYIYTCSILLGSRLDVALEDEEVSDLGQDVDRLQPPVVLLLVQHRAVYVEARLAAPQDAALEDERLRSVAAVGVSILEVGSTKQLFIALGSDHPTDRSRVPSHWTTKYQVTLEISDLAKDSQADVLDVGELHRRSPLVLLGVLAGTRQIRPYTM